MPDMNYQRYKAHPTVDLPGRKWPSRQITKAPIWCSVDLRDGNQALEVPMTLEEKVEFFEYLCSIGFKEIEIGFPAALLTQSRSHIIDKTMEAVSGAPNVIIHLYNATSTLHRDVVFDFSCDECINLAVDGAKMIIDRINEDKSGTNFILEYSPEAFSDTELDFAVKICDSVLDCWKPTPDKKVIINLPLMYMPTRLNISVSIPSGEIQ